MNSKSCGVLQLRQENQRINDKSASVLNATRPVLLRFFVRQSNRIEPSSDVQTTPGWVLPASESRAGACDPGFRLAVNFLETS